MDILTSPETFVIGGILAIFFVLNELIPILGSKAMYLLAATAGALVFMIHNNIL